VAPVKLPMVSTVVPLTEWKLPETLDGSLELDMFVIIDCEFSDENSDELVVLIYRSSVGYVM
jgi:hypothetical protein